MEFSGKMCFMIMLKVTKTQSFTLSLEDTFFEKPQRGGEGVKLTHPPAVLGLSPNKTVFSSKTLMCKSNSSSANCPPALPLSKIAPQPDLEVSVFNKKNYSLELVLD